MSWLQILALALNVLNFVMLIVLPLRKRFRLWNMLYRHRDDIQFKVRLEMVGLPSLEEIRAGKLSHHRYVECRIDISPTDYITWKIWEDGTIIKYLDPKKTKWLNREHVVQFGPRKITDSDPLSSLAARYEFMRYEVKKVWEINFITRRILEKITAEPYVMAKLGGLEVHDPYDLA